MISNLNLLAVEEEPAFIARDAFPVLMRSAFLIGTLADRRICRAITRTCQTIWTAPDKQH